MGPHWTNGTDGSKELLLDDAGSSRIKDSHRTATIAGPAGADEKNHIRSSARLNRSQVWKMFDDFNAIRADAEQPD